MTKWKYTLNFAYFYNSDEISVAEKGKRVAARIRKLPLKNIECYCGDDFEELADRFEDITGYDDITPTAEFDSVMDELYDMANRYRIWIRTFLKKD